MPRRRGRGRGRGRISPPPPQPPPRAPKPVNDRGREWAVERLTGRRAQKATTYSYEVQWKGAQWKGHNSFEPAGCLVGFEAEMKKVDDAIEARANEPHINQAQVRAAQRELASQKKTADLQAHKQRLLRQQKRQRIRDDDDDDGSEDDDDADEEARAAAADQLAAELLAIETQLLRAQAPAAIDAAHDAPAHDAPAHDAAHPREGWSRVWLAIDRETNTCKLQHPHDKTKKCGMTPAKGGGTSGQRAHLVMYHNTEWQHILATGQVKTSVEMIEDALKAKQDQSKPALDKESTNELHRLAALWVAKCGRPQTIVDDAELNTLIARILELCKSKLRYALPHRNTLTDHLALLGLEGKALARDLIVRLIKSGVKPSITGDLWSSNGMGLFGIYAHGITETMVMEKALIGLVACSEEVRACRPFSYLTHP